MMRIETPKYKSAGPVALSFVLLLVLFTVTGWVSGGGPLGAVFAFSPDHLLLSRRATGYLEARGIPGIRTSVPANYHAEAS
jgi:hypothetical protein